MASHTRRLISYIDYAGDSMQKMNMFHLEQEHNNILNCASEQQVVHKSQCMNCCFSPNMLVSQWVKHAVQSGVILA